MKDLLRGMYLKDVERFFRHHSFGVQIVFVFTVILCLCYGPCLASSSGYIEVPSVEKALVVIDPAGFEFVAIPSSHAEQMRAHKVRALASQTRILRFLEAERNLGRVRSFESLWITNAIWLEAENSIIETLKEFYEVVKVVRMGNNSPVIEYIPNESFSDGSVGQGPVVIGADSLWGMGLTGLGRLVCIVDTGVDGTHPALSESWRGVEDGVEWSEAWFDPFEGTQFPVDQNNHGTFMAGLILGGDGSDTVGVAPDAHWIAARALEGPDYIFQILVSLQWAFDPDGNPETENDVPDVIPMTWTLPGTCDDVFWDAIDHVESGGITVLTSAGANGPGPGTIGPPADRIESPVNCFSVGTVDGWEPAHTVAYFSSRGPSGCDDLTIKPEVVAPGINERSCVAGGEYSIWSGNTLSTAFVAGGLLLLEQSGEVSGPEHIKETLLYSAVDLGTPGEDNSYGWGLVNLPNALEELGGLTVVKVDLEPEFGTAQPGDSVHVEYEIENPTSVQQTCEVFLGVKPPSGNGVVLNRQQLSIDPMTSISGSVPLLVPLKAPAGEYRLVGLTAATSPFTIIDSDTIVVMVGETP